MDIRAAEISAILKKQIAGFGSAAEVAEESEVSEGIAKKSTKKTKSEEA